MSRLETNHADAIARRKPRFAHRWVGALTFIVIVVLGIFKDEIEVAFTPAVEPDYYLWAWRREEDLSFIDPSRVKVALWAATITSDHNGFIVEPRTNRATLPIDSEVVAVFRLEVAGVPGIADVVRMADTIVSIGRALEPIEYQIDFDARASQRDFYRHLLNELRKRVGEIDLSIAGLASWCFHDDWITGLPVDEVVPMIYRMGPDGNYIRQALFAERRFPNSMCAGNVGYSADEPLAPVHGLRRIFLFHPQPWSERKFSSFVRRIKELH